MSVCGGAAHYERTAMDCPVCGIKDSWIVSSLSSSAWWGSTNTCTNCGDSWADGELLGRPFLRGWRQQSIARALRDWEAGCECRPKWDKDMNLIPCEHQEPTNA